MQWTWQRFQPIATLREPPTWSSESDRCSWRRAIEFRFEDDILRSLPPASRRESIASSRWCQAVSACTPDEDEESSVSKSAFAQFVWHVACNRTHLILFQILQNVCLIFSHVEKTIAIIANGGFISLDIHGRLINRHWCRRLNWHWSCESIFAWDLLWASIT